MVLMGSLFSVFDDAVYGRALLFNDGFDTAVASLQAGTRLAAPGPGSATITDAAAVWSSIASGILTPSKATTTNSQPRYVISGNRTYTPGRAFIARVALKDFSGAADAYHTVGFSEDPAAFSASYPGYGMAAFFESGLKVTDWTNLVDLNIALPDFDEYVQIAVVMMDGSNTGIGGLDYGNGLLGGFYLFVDKKLRYFSTWGAAFDTATYSLSNAPIFGSVTLGYNASGRNPLAVDCIRLRDLREPFSNGRFASVDVRPPVNNTSYTATADGLYHFQFRAGGTDAGKCELRFRVQDDNNYWTAYYDGAADVFKVDSVAGGVATNRIAGADASNFDPSDPASGYRIMTEGSTVTLFSDAAGQIQLEGSATVNYLTTATTVKTVITGGTWVPSALICFPLSSPIYDTAFAE